MVEMDWIENLQARLQQALTGLPEAAGTPEEREELISTACRSVNPAVVKARVVAVTRNDALTQEELDGFDVALRTTDVLHSILDLSSQLADELFAPAIRNQIGQKLFELDDLIEALYSRPDVISVRWHVLQPDRPIPAWLLQAKELDEFLRGTGFSPPTPLAVTAPKQASKARRTVASDRKPGSPLPSSGPTKQTVKGLETLIAKSIGPEERIIRFRGVVAISGTIVTPGQPVVNPLSAQDGHLHLDILAGPEPGTITLEFAGKGPSMLCALVGYVLAPSIGGESIAGFVPLSADPGQDWSIGKIDLGSLDTGRLGTACHGVMAGPIELQRLSKSGYKALLGAWPTVDTQMAAWRAWAVELIRSSPDLPGWVRRDLSRLAGGAIDPAR
jgi:hypothetical protein